MPRGPDIFVDPVVPTFALKARHVLVCWYWKLALWMIILGSNLKPLFFASTSNHFISFLQIYLVMKRFLKIQYLMTIMFRCLLCADRPTTLKILCNRWVCFVDRTISKSLLRVFFNWNYFERLNVIKMTNKLTVILFN